MKSIEIAEGLFRTTPFFIGVNPVPFQQHEQNDSHVWELDTVKSGDYFPDGVSELKIMRCKCGATCCEYRQKGTTTNE